VGAVLSAQNHQQLWIPAGFAHAFITLSDTAEFLYKTTDFYAPQSERAIRWNDPDIGIDWPFDGEPLLSAKDQQAVLLGAAQVFD
jgi:dTDP-4-dehydrorhamnose 3,5-epimerase